MVAPNLYRECLSLFYLDLCALTFFWRYLSSCLSRWACWFYWLNDLTSSWLFQLVLVSNWYPWACEHIIFEKSSLYLGWAYLMVSLLNWYLLMAQPYPWCKCNDLFLVLCTRAFVVCSKWLWGSEDLIRLRRIYNFLCSMLDFISVPHVFISFWHDLWN